jgi:hypothetical protein
MLTTNISDETLVYPETATKWHLYTTPIHCRLERALVPPSAAAGGQVRFLNGFIK